MPERAGGEIGRLIAERDWSGSPLGPPDQWPQELRDAVRLILPAAVQIVMFWGEDYIALYNEAYAPAIGDKHPAAFGRPARESWAELWHDVEPLLRRVRETGDTFAAKDRPFHIERHGYREEVFFDISYSPLRNDAGDVMGVLCIVDETTAKVRQRARLMAERDRVWQVSGDLLGVADMDGVWRSVNPAWTRVLGWAEDEIVGRTSAWIGHPDDSAVNREQAARLADGAKALAFENQLRTRAGDYRTLSWTMVAEQGALYCTGRDVTAERAHQQELDEMQERLRQSQKMETVGQLTGGVAHDFNNLLQIIAGNLDMLLRTLPPDAARHRRAAEAAMGGAKRAATLTQRLLAFSRRQPLSPKPLSANRLISGMSELLHRSLGETVEVEVVLSPSLWRAEIDPNALENALLNLAVNARDAMPGGGKLTIETANTHLDRDYVAQHPELPTGQYVSISVSDTGHGMTQEVVERVFEPFFTTKEVGKGTGLGLSMVYGFVKQSGGHVKLYSEPGEGTTVRLYLPRLIGGAAEEGEPPPPPAPERAREETILVCEDDPEVRAFSAEVLRDLGYVVREAVDGPSALRLLEREDGRVDLLFTDVVLPGGMTGSVLAEKARRRRPDVKVLFTTGYARNAIVHHGRLDPGVELITKPFTYTDLAGRIRDLLDAPPRA